MSGTHEFKIKLHMDDKQYQRLCDIQSRLHEKHPQVWNTPEALFEDMITIGSRHLIDQRLDTFEKMYQNDVTKQSGQSEHPDGKVTSAVAERLAAFMLREMKMSNERPGTDFQTLAEKRMFGMTEALKILGIPIQTIQQGPGGKYTAVEIDGQTFPVGNGDQ